MILLLRIADMIILSFLVFLTTLSSLLVPTGILVKAATFSNPIVSTAVVLAVQSLATLSTVFVSRRFVKSPSARGLTGLLLGFSGLSGALITSINSSFSALILVVFIKSFSATLCCSWLVSLFRENSAHRDAAKLTREIQLVNALAWIVASALAAILGSQKSSGWLIYIDSALCFASAVLLTIGKNLKVTESTSETALDPEDSRMKPSFKHLNIPFKVSAISLVVWLCVGAFQVVELPLLNSRFGLQPNIVLVVLVTTIFCYFVTVILCPSRWIARYAPLFMWFGSGAMLLALALYIFSHTLTLVVTCVALFGISNALFILGQGMYVQSLIQVQTRFRVLIFFRFITIAGQFIGSLILTSLSLFDIIVIK